MAINYCRKIGGCYVTNETSEESKKILTQVISEDRYFALQPHDKPEKFYKFVKQAETISKRIIFDAGGYSDERLEMIIGSADLVCVPSKEDVMT